MLGGSNLAQFLVPQVYNFPEFVHWCAERYIASTRSFETKYGTLLFDIKPESISHMLRVFEFNDGQVINEESLAVNFKELGVQERHSFIQSLMKDNTGIFHEHDTYQTSVFVPNVQEIVCMICSVLVYDSDEIIDMIILGFLRAIFPPTTQVMVKF
jgi:hypothetical protein